MRCKICSMVVCLGLLLSSPLSHSAKIKRPLDLSSCEVKFDTYRDASIKHRRERVARYESLAKPPMKEIDKLKHAISVSENISGADFYGSLGVGMPSNHMFNFLQTLTLAEVRDRRKQELAAVVALESNDIQAYGKVIGYYHDSPADTANALAHSEAELCALEARFYQLTGKLASDNRFYGLVKANDSIPMVQPNSTSTIESHESAPTEGTSLSTNVQFAKDGRPTKGLKAFASK